MPFYFDRYEILNYQPLWQADGKVTYDYVTVGQWMTGVLELNESAIYWPRKGRDPDNPFQSACSQPCGPGFVKVSKTHINQIIQLGFIR